MVVQEVPTADQLEAIVLTVFQAGLHNVIATYGPTPHPVSRIGLTIVLNHPDRDRIAKARTFWVDQLAGQRYTSSLA